MSALPRVALLIDTNGGWGRDIVRGIGAFLRDANVRWQIAHEPRMVDNRIPRWLKSFAYLRRRFSVCGGGAACSSFTP